MYINYINNTIGEIGTVLEGMKKNFLNKGKFKDFCTYRNKSNIQLTSN